MRLAPFVIAIVASLSLFGAQPAKTVIDNDSVRVLEDRQDPHVKTQMHQHKLNRVMIYRTAGTQDIVSADGKKTVLSFKKNDVLWSPAAGMHTSEVASAEPLSLVEIELKKPGAGKKVTTTLDPVKVDPKKYKVEFENDQVRVTRVHYGPHESAPLHEHQLTRVILYLTDAHMRITAADGTVIETPHKAGEIVYGGAAKHSETNTSGEAIDIIVAELKYSVWNWFGTKRPEV